MPPAADRPPNPSNDDIQVRGGGPPAPARPPRKAGGHGSRTRFLSVKKFRFTRVRGLLFIGVTVLLFGFLTWCALSMWG